MKTGVNELRAEFLRIPCKFRAYSRRASGNGKPNSKGMAMP